MACLCPLEFAKAIDRSGGMAQNSHVRPGTGPTIQVANDLRCYVKVFALPLLSSSLVQWLLHVLRIALIPAATVLALGVTVAPNTYKTDSQ